MRNSEFIEIEGSTVKQAVSKALRTLKVSRDRVKIDILSEETKGLFGMTGEKPAKIRVSIIK